MVSVIKYKSIDPLAFSVSLPVKEGTHYTSKILYSDKDILIQTPELEVLSPDTFRFKLVNNGLFFTLIEEIQEQIARVLYNNSANFFKGKSFSKDRIKTSMREISEIRDDGFAYIKGLVLDNDTKFIDFFNDQVTYPKEFPCSGKFMIRFTNILYDKSVFHVNLYAKSCKLTLKKETLGNFKECILDEDSDIEEEPLDVRDDKSVAESNYSCGQTEEEPQNCVDDLDFF